MYAGKFKDRQPESLTRQEWQISSLLATDATEQSSQAYLPSQSDSASELRVAEVAPQVGFRNRLGMGDEVARGDLSVVSDSES